MCLNPLLALLKVVIDTNPNLGKKIAKLTIEQSIARDLENSPEIRVVSFKQASKQSMNLQIPPDLLDVF
jgi:hypothetical protein